jgi:hypothetical protein
MIRLATFCAFALLAAATARAADETAVDEEFYKQKKEAEANLQTTSGAEYDRILGQHFASDPAWKAGTAKCLEANPAPQEVRGFLDFRENGTFRLILRPTGDFASCMSHFVEGMNLPRPTKLPYRNDFNFNTEY